MRIICHDVGMFGFVKNIITQDIRTSVINAIVFGAITIVFYGLSALHILPDSFINGPIGFLLQFIMYLGLFFFIALSWKNYQHKKNLAQLEREKAILLMGPKKEPLE